MAATVAVQVRGLSLLDFENVYRDDVGSLPFLYSRVCEYYFGWSEGRASDGRLYTPGSICRVGVQPKASISPGLLLGGEALQQDPVQISLRREVPRRVDPPSTNAAAFPPRQCGGSTG